ncbi:hypothetical protein PARPLA_01872 [Rhodobacteraceae bacterium THAF1]|uniref:hypothetical protein n=1 Tax=Palleronia sp. THAF1 TaxID=2587842 RepID=UPI000F3BE18E|nr:hypothetical protein [Palleronia sp. THAF1]QFU08993.1 hypothetical protein FIU81_09940 [Palleronia sp. THAF1]VDC24268.1 hypothetical protein PARPLA_01872 [Rhodobacteraceae bacterium THAF1]
MTSFFKPLKAKAEKRAAYRETRHILRSLPQHVAHDLNIDRRAAERMARVAVYGG